MLVVDLFSGAGGAHRGISDVLPRAVHVCVDMDSDACMSLLLNNPGTTVYRMRVDRWLEEHADALSHQVELLWASPPCQPYSHSGKREGSSDVRDAWPDTLAAVRLLRSQRVVVENVRGAPVDVWADQIRELGYRVAVWKLDSASFGVPQHRTRFFVVGIRGRILWPVSPKPTHGPGLLPYSTMREALHLDNHLVAVGGDHNPGFAGDKRVENDLSDRPSTTIAAPHGGSNATPKIVGRVVNGPLEGSLVFMERNHGARGHTVIPEGPAPTVVGPPSSGGGYDRLSVEWGGTRGGKGYLVDDTERPAPSVTTAGDMRANWWHRASPADEPSRTIGTMRNASITYPKGWGRAGTEPERLDRPAACVSATEEKGTNYRRNGDGPQGGPPRASDSAFLATGRRRLTVEECAILQDFLPTDRFVGTVTSRYKQVGNSVPRRLAAAVVRALLESDP